MRKENKKFIILENFVLVADYLKMIMESKGYECLGVGNCCKSSIGLLEDETDGIVFYNPIALLTSQKERLYY